MKNALIWTDKENNVTFFFSFPCCSIRGGGAKSGRGGPDGPDFSAGPQTSPISPPLQWNIKPPRTELCCPLLSARHKLSGERTVAEAPPTRQDGHHLQPLWDNVTEPGCAIHLHPLHPGKRTINNWSSASSGIDRWLPYRRKSIPGASLDGTARSLNCEHYPPEAKSSGSASVVFGTLDPQQATRAHLQPGREEEEEAAAAAAAKCRDGERQRCFLERCFCMALKRKREIF